VGANVFGFGLVCPGLDTARVGSGEGEEAETTGHGFAERPYSRTLSGIQNPGCSQWIKGALWLNFAVTVEPC
jgi:hypothetical protein